MINPGELRIGNWAKTSTNRLVQFDEIRSDKGEYEFIYPIPLTPEILMQCCGFVKVHEMYFRETAISGSETLDSSFCLDGESEYYICMQLPFYQPPIETLHHLQNLFYVLSGDELPVDVERLKELINGKK